MSDRALAPVVGMSLLVGVTVLLAAVVGAAALDLGGAATAAPDRPTAALSLSVDGDRDRLRFAHRGGDALDATRLGVRVTVDGRPLAHQPPVPFFAARGYRGGPTGPFNPAADPRWTAGEVAAFRVAGTNAPALAPGATVTATLRYDGVPVAELTAVVN